MTDTQTTSFLYPLKYYSHRQKLERDFLFYSFLALHTPCWGYGKLFQKQRNFLNDNPGGVNTVFRSHHCTICFEPHEFSTLNNLFKYFRATFIAQLFKSSKKLQSKGILYRPLAEFLNPDNKPSLESNSVKFLPNIYFASLEEQLTG